MNAGSYDAVIIGSGFGGAPAAYTLARAGLKVLLLERGGWAKRDAVDWDQRRILLEQRYKAPVPMLVDQDRRGLGRLLLFLPFFLGRGIHGSFCRSPRC